jgi:hypothetical protein
VKAAQESSLHLHLKYTQEEGKGCTWCLTQNPKECCTAHLAGLYFSLSLKKPRFAMKPIKLLILVTLAALIAGACSLPTILEGIFGSAPTATIEPTVTCSGCGDPTEEATVEPTLEPTPTETLTMEPTGRPVVYPDTYKLGFIALDDNGASGALVGCGDSLVLVSQPNLPSDDPIVTAFTNLLAFHDQYYGASGLYNVLYESNLNLVSAEVLNGAAIIHLSGSLNLRGTCDAPRVQAQLEAAARQADAITEVVIYINDVPLADVLSQQ